MVKFLWEADIKKELKKLRLKVSRKNSKKSFEKLMKSLSFDGFFIGKEKVLDDIDFFFGKEVEVKKAFVKSRKKKVVVIGEKEVIDFGYKIANDLNAKSVLIPLYPSSKEILERKKNTVVYFPRYFWMQNWKKILSGILDGLSLMVNKDVLEKNKYAFLSFEISKNVKRMKDVEKLILYSTIASNHAKITGLEHEIIKNTEKYEHGELVASASLLILFLKKENFEEFLSYVEKYTGRNYFRNLFINTDILNYIDFETVEKLFKIKKEETVKEITTIL